MKVRNMISAKTGREIANQFIIEDASGTIYFQSYSSIIAKRENGKLILDRDKWDYSKTTGKYRNQFLGETKKETEERIKKGIYILGNLN